MKKILLIIIGIFLALASIILVFVTATAHAGTSSSPDTLRYRISVTIETPEGIKTGSAVREASTYREISLVPGAGGTFRHVTKGEAVVVDLGKRGVLFSLIDDEDEARFVFKKISHTDDGISKTKAYPYLQGVKFSDLKDCKTVQSVGPKSISNIFGEGVTLQSIEIYETKDPVTVGQVEKWLPWLQGLKGYISGKGLSGPQFYEQLLVNQFKIG